jgi:DNA-binding MarR family transcriptional regulator
MRPNLIRKAEPGFAKVPLRIADRRLHKLSAANLRVYVLLCSHADRNGVCRVSMKKLAEETGISREHVARSIGCLEKAGEIRREKDRRSNRYVILAIEERLASSAPMMGAG